MELFLVSSIFIKILSHKPIIKFVLAFTPSTWCDRNQILCGNFYFRSLTLNFFIKSLMVCSDKSLNSPAS